MTTTNDHFHVQRGTSDKMMYPTVICHRVITQGCYPGATISLQKQKQLHTYTKKKQLSFQEAAIVIVIVIEYDMHNDLTFSENQKYTSCCACGATIPDTFTGYMLARQYVAVYLPDSVSQVDTVHLLS